ncbi:hypothetical protein AB1K70_03420 [Bremerella sp. JC770]|uniref:hypothetical protein n=1 Tax=Bremerella sp. JC770 TaxID=3232137 RepID=UPI00345AC892
MMNRLETRGLTQDGRLQSSGSNTIQHTLDLTPLDGVSGGNKTTVWRMLGTWLGRIIAFISNSDVDDATTTVQGRYGEFLHGISHTRQPINGGMGNTNLTKHKGIDREYTSDSTLAVMRRYTPSLKKHGETRETAYRVATEEIDRPLFADGVPKLADLKQSYQCRDGELLSVLGCILSQQGGAERIQGMMRDMGDGSVVVRFNDCEVIVSKNRLVDASGDDLFSAGAPWVRIMEKAYLGYLGRKFRESESFQSSESVTMDDFTNPEVNISYRFEEGGLDNICDAFSHVLHDTNRSNDPADPDPAGANTVNYTCRVNIRLPSKSDGIPKMTAQARTNLAESEFNDVDDVLKSGGTVVARTHARVDALDRMTPNQYYTLLGTCRRQFKDGTTRDGYLVFDPSQRWTKESPFLRAESEGTDNLGDTLSLRGTQNRGEHNYAVHGKPHSERGFSPVFFLSAEKATGIFDAVFGTESFEADDDDDLIENIPFLQGPLSQVNDIHRESESRASSTY